MNKIIQWIIGLVAGLSLILSSVALVGDNQSGSYGADGDTNLTNLVLEGDLTVGDDTTFTDDIIVSGGTATITTTNAATSTLSVGCIQMVATSTASPIILAFGTSFTGTTTLPTGAAASNGLVAWKFGTCPQ